jgi:hypothetical protein
MTVKSKKTLYALLLIGCALLGVFLWLSLRSVEVVAVHEDGDFSSVLVRNFPLTDRGKISWWLKNKEKLKVNYNIPKPAKDGFFSIVFWDFGDGYKEEGKYDRRCFEDMKIPLNCIDKKPIFAVRQYRDDDIIFATYEGRYSLNKNNNIIKVASD